MPREYPPVDLSKAAPLVNRSMLRKTLTILSLIGLLIALVLWTVRSCGNGKCAQQQ